MGRGSFWLPHEDEFLQAEWLAGRLSARAIAAKLGRTLPSTRMRAHRLGLIRSHRPHRPREKNRNFTAPDVGRFAFNFKPTEKK